MQAGGMASMIHAGLNRIDDDSERQKIREAYSNTANWTH